MALAAEGGSPDAHAAHFGYVQQAGRLLVAVLDDAVVGVAGSVPALDMALKRIGWQ